MIPSLVVTVLELHCEFDAETVPNRMGGAVIVVEIGTLVVIVDPRLLIPIMGIKNGVDEEVEEVVAVDVGKFWGNVDGLFWLDET